MLRAERARGSRRAGPGLVGRSRLAALGRNVRQVCANGVATTANSEWSYPRLRPSLAVFRNIEEVRSSVADFIKKYNQQWLIGKLRYRSPAQARLEYFQALAA
jgi:transposase InsO family protein